MAELSWLSPFAANITDCCSHCCCAAAMAILLAISRLVAVLDHKRHLPPNTNTLPLIPIEQLLGYPLDSNEECLPSPEQLKYKILIKVFFITMAKLAMATVHKKIAVAIEYFNKIQNNRHSENFKMFHSLRFDSNLSHL